MINKNKIGSITPFSSWRSALQAWLLRYCMSCLATGRTGLRYRLALGLDDFLEGRGGA